MAGRRDVREDPVEYTVYKYCAIVGGVLVGLQLILQLLGLGGDHDIGVHTDVDVDHGDLHGEAGTEGHGNVFAGILSFKALSAFAGVFGLVGLLTIERGLGPAARVATSAGAGVASMFVVAWTMRALARLQASGTVNVANAIGTIGTVYLRIPGQGFAEIVKACGDAQAAFQMMMLEHMDHLADTAANAISNIKFDKVVVWDPGTNGNGKSATAGFLQGLAGSLPPMLQMMRDIGGVQMPEYFGKVSGDTKAAGTETARATTPPAKGDGEPRKKT
jgi:hypothetical protein